LRPAWRWVESTGHKRQRSVDATRTPAAARVARWLRTPEGTANYRPRKVIPEPVFGWIRQVLSFRSFTVHRITAVSAEWRLICTARTQSAIGRRTEPPEVHLPVGADNQDKPQRIRESNLKSQPFLQSLPIYRFSRPSLASGP
jgi:hypothetical protein